jgi:hypothetical protein
MADYWIVTTRTYHRHDSAEAAYMERRRLAALDPKKTFKVVRCKTHPQRGRAIADVRAFLERLAALAPSEANAAEMLTSAKLQAALLLRQLGPANAPANYQARTETPREAAHG